MKILIADDNYQDVFLAKDTIETLDINADIFEAENGIETLDIIEKENPEIVLLDIKMPKMDGLETLKIIKEKYPKTKVIMLTTSDYDKDILAAHKLNADAYIVKPIDTYEFEKKLEAVRSIYIDQEFEFVKFEKIQ